MKKIIFLFGCLFLAYPNNLVYAQAEIEPIEVFAQSEPTYIIAGEVQYTLKFWNVGVQNPDSKYGKAILETKCLQAEGGWECADVSEIKEGIFSGGPDGTFSFGDASFKLVKGQTAVLPAEGFSLTFTVQNPEAFTQWQIESKDIEDSLPRLEKSTDGVEYKHIESIGLTNWLTGQKSEVKFPVSSEILTNDGKAVVIFPDGSRMIVLENTIIRFTNSGLFMEKGCCYLEFKKQDKVFLLQDSRANYEILGTTVYWDTDDKKTIFDVIDGMVQISRLAGVEDKRTLITGESVVVVNEEFYEVQNFAVENRSADMKSVDESIINNNQKNEWPIGWTVGIVGIIVLLFGGYLWLGKR